jgi:hypothetical protein
LGRRVEADHELAMAEETFAGEKSSWIGMVYAARNDADRAFTWFDRAFGQHDDGLLWVKGDPLLVQVTHDPRYKALLSKMNLPE